MDALVPLNPHDAADDALLRCRSIAAAMYEAISNHPALNNDSTPSLIVWELARTMEERVDAAIAAHDAEHQALRS